MTLTPGLRGKYLMALNDAMTIDRTTIYLTTRGPKHEQEKTCSSVFQGGIWVSPTSANGDNLKCRDP